MEIAPRGLAEFGVKKVVYLIEQPLDERNYDRFGIQRWIDRGWHVEVWDLTPLLHPRVWQAHVESAGRLKEYAHYFPVTSKDFPHLQCAQGEKADYLIDFAGDDYFSTGVKRRLINRGATRILCATGSIPGAGDGQKSTLAEKIRKAAAAGPHKAIKLLTSAVMRRFTQASIQPGLIVVSGETSVPAAQGGKLVKAHNLDYDIYMEIAGIAGAASNDAVFIDQDYCFHPEYAYQNSPSKVTPEKYFAAVCRGLKKISAELDVGLRIAAHPRTAHRQRAADYFQGIPVEYGNTAEMVKNCKVVVCHDSTAIQFAVLFGKPVIFVTTDQLNSLFFDSSFKSESIARFASELGKSVINLDRDLDGVDWAGELAVDSSKYSSYKNRYIKMHGSPEVPFWEIVIDQVEAHAEPTACAASAAS
ncbi:MAG: hypothetical protein ACYDBZ_04215 [Steroidobacteraceae bacterium]